MSIQRKNISQAINLIVGDLPVIKQIALNQIIPDPKTQPRTTISEEIVQDYAEAMEMGNNFPPIIVFKDDDGVYWLADGFHRYFAAKSINKTSIKCDIRKGSLRDAMLFSVGANATHGLRRTNEDKRKAVLTLLSDEEWSKYSANKIADITGVTQPFISKVKKELGIDSNISIGADGKVYNTKNIGQRDLERTNKLQYYKFKLDLSYKELISKAIQISNKNEMALLKEAMEYIRNKYLKDI